MFVPPLGLPCSQEIFRQNILLCGEDEVIDKIGKTLEATVCFLLLVIRNITKIF
jgi:hypothetical protein